MKNKYIFLLIPLVSIISSCALLVPTEPEPQVKEIRINYDFQPPETNTDNVDIAFLFINPIYAKEFEEQNAPMYADFVKNMAIDFEEMLIAKGYSIRGPFATLDEIVFSDKTETDLLLEVEIDMNQSWSEAAFKRKLGYKGTYIQSQDKYYLDGSLFLSGKLNLVIKEALTQEKLWVKSVPMVDKTIRVKTKEYEASDQQQGYYKVLNDISYKNSVYSALNDCYQKAMLTAWNHMNPDELKVLKNQVKVLREKKGY